MLRVANEIANIAGAGGYALCVAVFVSHAVCARSGWKPNSLKMRTNRMEGLTETYTDMAAAVVREQFHSFESQVLWLTKVAQ